MSKLDEEKVREGAKKIIVFLQKYQQLLNELTKNVPLPCGCDDRFIQIIAEEIDKSNLDSLLKEAVKTSLLGMFQKEPDYVR